MRSVRFTPLPVLLILLTLGLAASPALAVGGRVHRAENTPGHFSTVWQALGELVPWLGVTALDWVPTVSQPTEDNAPAGSSAPLRGKTRNAPLPFWPCRSKV